MGAKSYYFEDNQIKPMGDIPEEPSSNGNSEVQNDLLKDTTILVIDDNPINLTVANKTLAKFGAKTVKALRIARASVVTLMRRLQLLF